MAIRRLYNAFKGFASDPRFLRADSITPPESGAMTRPNTYGSPGAFTDKALVLAVSAREGAIIQYRALVVDATQATDEPLRAGQEVYISRTNDGTYIILGTVK